MISYEDMTPEEQNEYEEILRRQRDEEEQELYEASIEDIEDSKRVEEEEKDLLEKLEKEYEEREAKEKERKKEEKEILDRKFTKREKREIREKAEQIEKLFVLDKWMKLFNQVSFCNELFGQALFHYVLGQQLAILKIEQSSGNWLDYRIHPLLIQASGTGKGKAIDFTRKVLGQVKKVLRLENNRVITRPIRHRRADADTDAGLLNDLAKDNKGNYTEEEIPGVLERFDCLLWEEAKCVLKPGSFNERMQEILMTVMEPIGSFQNEFSKHLKGYPIDAITKSGASICPTTRPLPNLKLEFLNNGLPQRCLTMVRWVDDDIRDEMNEKANLASIRDENDTFEQDLQEIVKLMNEIVEVAALNPPKPALKQRKELLSYINRRLGTLHEDAKKIPIRENKEILQTFISRYRDNMMKLAFHSAVIRKNNKVEEQDLEYAFNFIRSIYKMIKYWVEDVAEMMGGEKKQKKIRGIIRSILWGKQNGIEQKLLVNILAARLDKSVSYSHKLIRDLCKETNPMMFSELGKDKRQNIIKLKIEQ